MKDGYLENPRNWDQVERWVNKDEFIMAVFGRKKCFFYDTCSFRYHANLKRQDLEKILEYIKREDGIVILTRCILMELGSVGGEMNPEYIRYIQYMDSYGIPVYVIYEEELFGVMEQCFSTNASINELLSWAVKLMKGPVSTITKTLDEDVELYNVILKGKGSHTRNVYSRFFSAVRANKEQQDNLGEELLGICLHILSMLPGEEDGKFGIFTDDKGAASKIDYMFRKTNRLYRGKKIIIYSTPKLAGLLLEKGYISKEQELIPILSAGNAGNIKILGTQIYDLECREVSLEVEELATKLIKNEIHIVF